MELTPNLAQFRGGGREEGEYESNCLNILVGRKKNRESNQIYMMSILLLLGVCVKA